MPIQLSRPLPIPNPADYKVHLASWDGTDHPLDVFVRDSREWDGWNSWRASKDDFNRAYILALIDFYPEPDVWLFGGIYRVVSRAPTNYSHSYHVERVPEHDDLVGRLKIRFTRPSRARSISLEKYFEQMTVSELLKETYTGVPLPRLEWISLDFDALEGIFKTHRPDWRAVLENVKGVYVIFDKRNGKKYVGAAYGDAGVWARWNCYIETGHGGNEELTTLIAQYGLDYARQNFRITLLEFRSASTDDRVILEREQYWKEALLSRGQFGYNKT